MFQRLIALSVIGLLVTAACGGTPAATTPSAVATAAATAASTAAASANPGGPFLREDSAEWKTVLDAAKREGEITVYGPRSPEIVSATNEFQTKFGVKLNYVVGSSGETQQRMLAEKDSGKIVASVVMTGDATVWNLGPGKEQLLVELKGLPNGARMSPAMYDIVKESNSFYWPIYAQVYGIYINTSLVSEAEAPKNWKDLLDPKWKGKIVQHDPTRNGGGQAMWGAMLKTTGYGETFLASLAKQDLMVVTGGGDPAAITARGERAIGIPGNVFEVTTQKGAPFKFIRPTDGLVTSQFVIGLVGKGPAPSAAKVFVNWVLSPEMQSKFVLNAYNQPAITGVAGGDYDLNIEKIKLLGPGRIPPQEADAVSAKAKTILAAK